MILYVMMVVAASVPGFDTRAYPGDDVMQAWHASSPYRWVGYYLQAPCFTNTSWTGRRAALTGMGWGLAVVFLGEHDWPATTSPRPARDTSAAASQQPLRCTRTNLTSRKAAADAMTADSAAQSEGFARGTIIYVDVEPVDSVSQPLRDY